MQGLSCLFTLIFCAAFIGPVMSGIGANRMMGGMRREEWRDTEGVLVVVGEGELPVLVTAREMHPEMAKFLLDWKVVSGVRAAREVPFPRGDRECEHVEHGILMQPQARANNFFHVMCDYIFPAYGAALRAGWVSAEEALSGRSTNATLRIFTSWSSQYDRGMPGRAMIGWLVPYGIERAGDISCVRFRRFAVAAEFLTGEGLAAPSWNAAFRGHRRMLDTGRAARAFRAELLARHVGTEGTLRVLARTSDEFIGPVCAGREPFRLGIIQRRGSRFLRDPEGEARKMQQKMLPWQIDVRVIFFEDMSAGEAALAAANVHALLGVHGAGMSHAMFLSRGATLLEVVQESMCYWPGTYFRNMAHGVGARHLKYCTPAELVETRENPVFPREFMERFARDHMVNATSVHPQHAFGWDTKSIRVPAHEMVHMVSEALGGMCGDHLLLY